MIKRVFIDANIIIDNINTDNNLNKSVTLLLSGLVDQNAVILCSPVSFAIAYYYLGKKIKSKRRLNEKAIEAFSSFSFTRENSEIMARVMQSSFTDLEDALQYYSALDAKAEAIITINYFDFYESTIPVYHPLQYINQFLL